MFFNATQHNERMNSTDVVYVGGDWITLKSTVVPTGSFGLGQITSSSSLGKKYIKLWEEADPNTYVDTDGNRSTISGWYIKKHHVHI